MSATSGRSVRILGIDPGSRLTGYGCIDWDGRTPLHVGHGTFRLSNTSGKATIALEQRLLSLFEGLTQVIDEWKPQVLVVERVFFAKNAVSALKLGQARGVILLAGAVKGLSIAEYSPTQVKSAVVGHGQADKDEVARMVRLLIKNVGEFGTNDASDALALALGHAKTVGTTTAAKALYHAATAGTRSSKRRSLADLVPADVLAKGKLKSC